MLLLANKGPTTLEERVNHDLLMLLWYGVFDQLSFQVNGSTVTLMGKVARPVLKSDAANVVKRIPGVASGADKTEVLPLSPFDDRIRLSEFRVVFANSALFRYRVAGPVAPIRIIGENRDLILEGIVAGTGARPIPRRGSRARLRSVRGSHRLDAWR